MARFVSPNTTYVRALCDRDKAVRTTEKITNYVYKWRVRLDPQLPETKSIIRKRTIYERA